jgi:SAM-dependent methyltransferase
MTTASSQQKTVATTTAKAKRGGRLALSFYRFTYRHGRPRWDSVQPQAELVDLVAGRRRGRALDVGCGTGTDALYLAQHGWDVVGVDFVPEAIETARKRAVDAGLSPRFVVGDVTQLRRAGVGGPFDLIMDTGCYHGIAAGLRDAYAAEVAAVAAPGADFYVAGISDPPTTWRLLGARGVSADDLRRHFGNDFDLADEQRTGARGRMAHFVLYHLVRRQSAQSEVQGGSRAANGARRKKGD